MTKYSISCLCCTYNRPVLLEESIKCFIDQDYDNKELIILNDQEGVTLNISRDFDNIKIYNHSERFESLGAKRNYIKTLGNGDYYCIWDDDDLYTPYRLSESVDLMQRNPQVDIIKPKDSFITFDGIKYKLATNKFHSQACIRKEYMNNHNYPLISLGEDAIFERGAKKEYIDIFPSFWSIFRCQSDTYHLSSVLYPYLQKQAWDGAKNDTLKGDITLQPKFRKDYWEDMKNVLNKINGFWGNEFYEKIRRNQ